MAQYEVTLRDYWRILRRRKGIVIFTGLLLGFFSFALASVWKPLPLYRAAAKVQISTNQTLTGLYLQTIAYNAGDQIETQQAIVTSYPVLKRVGEELGLFAGGDTAQVVLDLQERISTRQEGYTNIIAIEATDPRPLLARALANTVARMYREYDHELKNQQAVKHRLFVEEQRDKGRQALGQAEEEVRFYREATDLVSLDAQASVMLGQITQGDKEEAHLEQIVLDIDAMLQEMESEGGLSEKTIQGASKTQVGDTFMAFSHQLNNLRLDREVLLVQFTEGHPRVKQLQVRISQLSQNLIDELRQRRQAVVRDLDGVRARLEGMRGDYNRLPSRGLQLARLQREVTLRQEVVAVLEEEYQNALIREADKVEEVTILQWAITPTIPLNPNHPLKRAFMGIVLGLVLGVVFAVVAETLDTSIGTIEDVQEYTDAQVVGVIPFIQVDEVEASLRRRGQGDMDRRTLQRKAQLVAYFDSQSNLAETFRTLRTNIEFASVEKGVKGLMVTSSTSEEGKSTVVANLAMTMAQLGKRTLLVDCDLRKPAVARLFGLDKEPGLTEVIVGNYQWSEIVRTVTDIVTGGMGMEDIMQTQGISNLHIITSGSVPPNPAELLNSRKMNEFIEAVNQAYDVVLFDAPPVLHVTDAAILGKNVDGALMVYKVGDIPRTSLRRSVNLLRSVEVELLGIVLNGIRAEISTDYQDFGYGSYYAYGRDVAERQRSLAERLHGFVARWQGRGEADEEYSDDYESDLEEVGEEFEEIEALDPERLPAGAKGGAAKSRARAIVSAALLALIGMGLAWQSGYLHRPLGLIPVFAGYRAGGGESQLLPEAPEETPEARPGEVGEDEPAPPAAATAVETETPAPPEKGPVSVSRAPPEVGASPYAIRIAAYKPTSTWAGIAVQELRDSGEEAFLVPVVVDGRSVVRLLTGSFARWDDAHGQARKLQAQGLVEEFAIVRLPYAVELGIFPAREPAQRTAAQLQDRGYSTYVQVLEKGEYRLLAGAFETPEEAEVFAGDLPAEVGKVRVVKR